jgi:hypothetical protein
VNPFTDLAPDMSTPDALSFEAEPPRNEGSRSWAERLLWALVGVMIINWSVTLLSTASFLAPVAVLDVGAGFWGLGVVVVSMLDLDGYAIARRFSGTFAWANAILVIVLMGVWAHLQFHANPSYGTDELSFDQYSAQLIHHGLNPYTHSMKPSFQLFRLSIDEATHTTTGAGVFLQSYPSLAFLIYMPFVLLGWTTEMANAIDVAAWMVTIVMLFVMLPKQLRPVSLLLGSVSVYLGTVTGGVTDFLYIPFLLIAAYRWDRFGNGWRSYIGPVALGLAMAIKQTPWPLLVFMVIAIGLDEFDRSDLDRALRRCGRYLAATLITFLIPNLPFIVMSPSTWVRGVFTPFTKNLVPSGQGIVALTLFDHLGGGSLTGFTIAMVLVGVVVLAAYVGTYPLLRPATFLLAAIVYMFAARSQTNYLIEFIPVVFVGAITVGPARWPARVLQQSPVAPRSVSRLVVLRERLSAALSRTETSRGPLRSRRWGIAILASCLLAAAATIYTLTDSAPLTIRITGIRTTGFLAGIRQLNVSVTNNSDQPLTPHYTVQTRNGDTTFWTVYYGPLTVKPGTTAYLHLTTPNYAAEPGLGDGFSVTAFTNSPSTVSVSRRFLLNLPRTAMNPSSFNRPVTIGKRILLQVQLLTNDDTPLRKRGVAVTLTQVLYIGRGTHKAWAIINGGKVGKRNHAYTDADGIATFHIVGTRAGSTPTTFSAHLFNKGASYIYGSTGYLDIRFKWRGKRAR